MEIIEAAITDEEFINLDVSTIPIKIAMRILLNSKGIKFQNDGKPSAIINENPIPLGTLSWNYDYKTFTTHYKQVID